MAQGLKSIAIAVDALPYQNSIHTVCDYGGQQIFGKCALPLYTYRNSQLVGLAAEHSEFSKDKKKLTVKLRTGLFWSDGSPVVADHYANSFKEIIRSPSNRFSNLLSDIAGYGEYANFQSDDIGIGVPEKLTIVLNLRNGNKWLPSMLSQLNFSPSCGNPELSAGPYCIKHQSSAFVELLKNKWYLSHNPSTVERLTFINYEPYHDRSACIEDYFRGTIDITCDTVMRLEDYKKYSHLHEFHSNLTRLGVFLVPGTSFASLPSQLRQSLFHVFNRQEISDSLLGFAAPLTSYSGLYLDEVLRATKDLPPLSQHTITILYDEFYPNLTIAKILQKQLKRLGIQAQLKPVGFGDWSAPSDLRLTICPPAIYGPLGFFKNDLFRGYLTSTQLAKAKILYSLYLSGLSPDVEAAAAAGMEEIISNEGLSIPLVTLPTAALVRKNILPSSFYEVGTPVQML
ncbi:ABC transporter substrate-binding protein [Pseudomonas sp.]|uniref:ABC transporter substrate-binding protein n=1 Tax=Pseudomonas sp. TaxID=306 RepID=UPI002587A1B0|nr:ABC transporter substrate-binding protein [Pseudomonas sp.]